MDTQITQLPVGYTTAKSACKLVDYGKQQMAANSKFNPKETFLRMPCLKPAKPDLQIKGLRKGVNGRIHFL